MKKSLLALVVLGAFAGAASAQSSVVIFGKLDQAFGKPIGNDNKQILDTAGSRIAFRGSEDLGGGLSAIFAFEHRFVPDAGTAGTAATFWDGFSFIGLRSATLGTVTIGRQYTSSFQNVQNQIDPFAGETVGSLRQILIGSTVGNGGPAVATTADVPNNWYGPISAAGPAKVRAANSVKYAHTFSGFTFSGDIAEATAAQGPDRPYSVAFSYAGGPLWAGVAFENAGGTNDRLINVGARYKIGIATLAAGFSDGKVQTPLAAGSDKFRAYLIGATVAVGAGDIKAGYATAKVSGVTQNERFAVGYHYNLSKRTKIYADVAHEGKLPSANDEKTGYDLGVQHQF